MNELKLVSEHDGSIPMEESKTERRRTAKTVFRSGKLGGEIVNERIEIGAHKDGGVSLDMKKASNRHIAIFGRSGSGKSVAGQKIIRNIIANEGCPIVVFDMHQLFDENNIFPDYRSDIREKSHAIDVYSDGISIPLFDPLKYTDGEVEDRLDVTSAIVGVLSSALKLGSRQNACLYEAIDFISESNLYAQYGITALEKALSMVDDGKAVAVEEKLRYVLKRNVFRDGGIFLEDKKINILRISKFPETVQSLIVEIVLHYIWRLANTGKFLETGVCLFLDECQNLNWGKTGIISEIFSEGRKFGIQLIFITQTLGASSKSDRTRSLLQAGHQLYFSPAENENAIIAKMIGGERHIHWQMRLKSLGIGECIANGALLVNGVPYAGAVKIKI